METKLNLLTYKFPEITGADMAFPTINTDKILLAEAEARGFYNGYSKYNRLFSTLFFSGGKLHFKDGLDTDFKNKALPYLKALMGSFSPKHEHKEAVCAMLLSELVDIEKYNL